MRAVAACLSLLVASPVAAFPDGAPWDAADGEGCAECHFDHAIERQSAALEIVGLPEVVTPGADYALRLEFDGRSAAAGILFSVFDADGPAGLLQAPDDDGIETQGAQARTTQARQGASLQWQLRWRAPGAASGPIRFVFWGNAADGDGSPFGDRIHSLERTLRFEGAASAPKRQP